MWPSRDAICLDCRTTLPANAACPVGNHRVTALREPAGRSKLLDEVWGPVATRRRLREASRVAAIGSPTASLLDSCTGCDALELGGEGIGQALLVLAVVFIAIVIIWYAAKLIIELVRRYQNRPRPNGAGRSGPRFGRTFACGRVVADPATVTVDDPLTGRPGVAYGIELRARGRGVMLRDAATVGFVIELETGERVRIPAGACIVDASRGQRATVHDAYLALVDPLQGNADVEPFPGDTARVEVIAPGSRVEVHGPLISTPDHGETTYRDASVLLVPDGIPRLRVVRTNT